MTNPTSATPRPSPRPAGSLRRLHLLLRSNWITSLGAALMTLAVLGFLTITAMQNLGGVWAGPYTGLIGAVVAPLVFVAGLLLVPAGLLVYRRHLRERIDSLGDRPMKLARAVVVLTAINFAAVATAGYGSVHYMGTVQFCGKACHAVMEPEHVAFLRGPHSRVDCVKCHVEPTAGGFVHSKLNGMNQLVSFLRDTYHKPVPTPVAHLADAHLTCEQCHNPEKYLGTKLKVRPHFREDEKVSGYTNVLLMRTGGTAPDGRSVGIHWHVHPDAVVEYVAADDKRSEIPWLQVRKPDGSTVVYAADGHDHRRPEGQLRRMDCTDCHNRTGHAFEMPDQALDEAIAAGLISRELPFVKRFAMEALNTDWTRQGAADGIRQHLQQAYARSGLLNEQNRQRLEQAIDQVTRIWTRNVYPDLNLRWGTYQDLAGHAGCFRCHDGKHRTADGRVLFGPKQISPTGAVSVQGDSSCDRCHVVLSENEEDPAVLESLGLRR